MPCMNFSDEREAFETTGFSLTKWTARSRSSTVIQSRIFRYRRSVFSTRIVRQDGFAFRNASISPKPPRPACLAVSMWSGVRTELTPSPARQGDDASHGWLTSRFAAPILGVRLFGPPHVVLFRNDELVALAGSEGEPPPLVADDLARDGVLKVAVTEALFDLRHDAGERATHRRAWHQRLSLRGSCGT